jgi:hypothetical protein
LTEEASRPERLIQLASQAQNQFANPLRERRKSSLQA